MRTQIRRGNDLEKSLEKRRQQKTFETIRQNPRLSANLPPTTSSGVYGSRILKGSNYVNHALKGSNYVSNTLKGSNYVKVELKGSNYVKKDLKGSNYITQGLKGSNYEKEQRKLKESNYRSHCIKRGSYIENQPKPNIEKTIPRTGVVIAPPGQVVQEPFIAQNQDLNDLNPQNPKQNVIAFSKPHPSPPVYNSNEITGSRYYKTEKKDDSPIDPETNNVLEAFQKIFKEKSFFGHFIEGEIYEKELNPLALKFIEVTSKNSGLIFIWDFGAFIYKIDENDTITVEKIGPRK